MTSKPWAEMTNRDKCEAMAAWGKNHSGILPCDGYSCSGRAVRYGLRDCPGPCPMVEADDSCPDIADRLLKEGKV